MWCCGECRCICTWATILWIRYPLISIPIAIRILPAVSNCSWACCNQSEPQYPTAFHWLYTIHVMSRILYRPNSKSRDMHRFVNQQSYSAYVVLFDSSRFFTDGSDKALEMQPLSHWLFPLSANAGRLTVSRRPKQPRRGVRGTLAQ